MLEIESTNRFKKDLKRYRYETKIKQALNVVITLLTQLQPLPQKHVDHPLGNNWKGSRECHIYPDVLLVYRIDKNEKKLVLERLGSHSELF